MKSTAPWPALPLAAWRDTYATLHMWTQVVGKITLALTPRMNHFWNVAMQVTSNGLSTPTLTSGDLAFTMVFDFIRHRLVIECSNGKAEMISLKPMTVAAFYRLVLDTFARMGLNLKIWSMRVVIPNAISSSNDCVY